MDLQIIPMGDGVSPATLEAWEAASGQRLPPAYKAFLTQVNGGYPYPNIAFLSLPEGFPAHREGTILSVLYDWEAALEEMQGASYGKGVPPGMFFFGREPGGMEFLISLRPETRGVVYAWQGSGNAWGTDGNDDAALHAQADSFAAFMAKLGDTPDEMGIDYVGRDDLATEAVAVVIPDR